MIQTGKMQARVAIVGGGAAGFFAAANLANGHKVVILEKTGKLLSKVRISGGGRCNVTHHCFEPAVLSTRYPRGGRFVQKAYHGFGPAETIAWFKKRNVTLHTESDGRMFPVTNNSATIVQALMEAAEKNGVTVALHSSVSRIVPVDFGFGMELADGRYMEAQKVIIACGAFPKMSQYDWMKELGHTIIPPQPSLFTFNLPGHSITKLMGVAVAEVQIKLQGSRLVQEGPLLITHWGLSGPAVLKLSAWAAPELAALNYTGTVVVNWLGKEHTTALQGRWAALRQEKNRQPMGSKNPFGLPARLWSYLLGECEIGENIFWNELKSALQNKLIQLLTAHSFTIEGKTTFKEEFVTCGGIPTSEIEGNTMQSKIHPGLYFTGEILNVDGITGGYNFQHAWTSGYLAAQHINSNPD